MRIASDIQPIPTPSMSLEPLRRSKPATAIADALVIAKRDLRAIPRVPEALMDVTFMPILFVLLFRYVFGGAIATEGGSYVNFLIPGIIVQTMFFGGMYTAVGLATDIRKGVVDRFRSLPMARSAVIAGRTMSDMVRNMIGTVVTLAVGFAIGFRPDGGFGDWVAAIGLILLMSFAMSWVGAVLGLLARSTEAVQAVGFTFIFPLTFASSAFVPTETMPGWLRTFTDHQPVTVTVNAVRGWMLGTPIGSDGWQALAWGVGILIVAIMVSVWLYQRKTAA
ncbi:MAG: ABC transporter permease [Thermomicrobiales bacterium]